MASRVISIDLVGNNASAKRAIAEVGTASEKAARASAVAFDASTSKIGRSLKSVGTAASGMGVPFASSLNLIGTHFDKAGKSSKGFGSTISRIGAVEAVAAGAGIAVLATQVGDFINQARESAKIGRQTEAVIKSTGASANVTAPQVSALADRLSKMAGVDDELIQSGENVLLTFTSIRNEVGKGNNIFDQATEAALDMSSALGTDLQGAVIQVGKALQDPIRGITALRRVGVNFSDAQRDQIKTLVDTGRAMDAQKLILRELNTEFGGSAKAMADPFAKAQVQIENVKEEIGARLIPVVLGAGEAASTAAHGFQAANTATDGWLGKTVAFGAAVPVAVFAVEKLVQGGRAVVGQYQKVTDALRVTSAANRELAASSTAANAKIAGIGLGASVVAVAATAAVVGLAIGLDKLGDETDFSDKKLKSLNEDLLAGGEAAKKARDGYADVIGDKAAQDLQRYSDLLIANASEHDLNTTEAQAMYHAIHDGGENVVVANLHINKATDSLKKLTKEYGAAGVQSLALGAAQKRYADLLASGTASESELGRARREVTDASRENAATQDKVNSATEAGTDAANKNADATKSQKDANDDLAKSLKSLNDDLLTAESSQLALERATNDVGVSLLEATDATQEHGAASQESISAQFGLRDSILSVVGAAQRDAEASDDAKRARGQNISAIETENNKHDAALYVLELLRGKYPQLTKLIDDYRTSLDLIPETIETNVAISIPGGGIRITGTGIIRRASGGRVPGPGSGDTVPALLEPGEFVMRKSAVHKYGIHAMEALNAGDSPRFAGGGLVGRSSGFGGSGITNNITIYASGIEDFHRKVIEVMRQETTREGSIKRVRIAG